MKRIPRERCLACGGDCYDGQAYCDDCRVVCARCSGGLLDPHEVDARGICDVCQEREQVRENVRRLEAWAVAVSRRRLAEWLTRGVDVLPKRRRTWFAHVVFLWETSGERKELRKVVEWIVDDWRIKGRRFVVNEPTADAAIPEDWPEAAGR